MSAHLLAPRLSQAVSLAISATLLMTALCDAWQADKRPNILFIMSDDHTSQAIGAYGGRLAGLDPTPNIDRLAENGMRFDRVFCTNSICTPSRASIITGQHPQTNGVLDLNGSIPPSRQFLPQEMKRAGYQAAMIGKWHLKAEPEAFDHYCVLPGQGQYLDPDFLVRGEKDWPQNLITKSGEHSSDAITDLSLEWLRSGREKGKPFFLMHHFKAPHDMFEFAPRYASYLENVMIPEPENLLTPPAGSPGSAGLGSGLGKEGAPWKMAEKLGIPDSLPEPDFTRAAYQEYLKRYLRCVKGVDDNIGRLTDYLEETGELDNTIIIYTSDQGFFLGEHNLMDKRWIYDESMRMPFIVHWPAGVTKGSDNDWLIDNTDFAPTMLALASVPATPDYMQGRDFSPALRGESPPEDWRTAVYYRYWMHMAHNLAVPAHFGIRTDRHKLIFFYGTDHQGSEHGRTPAAWEFYDLKQDPSEMNNLYGSVKHRDIISAMKTQLLLIREELDETDTNRPYIQTVIDSHWNN